MKLLHIRDHLVPRGTGYTLRMVRSCAASLPGQNGVDDSAELCSGLTSALCQPMDAGVILGLAQHNGWEKRIETLRAKRPAFTNRDD
jgi:hypothetical protein